MKALKGFCRYVHRYCGWIVGIVFFVMCLTGCILMIQPEIEYIAEPTRFRAPAHPGETPMAPGTLIETFEKLESESFETPTTVRVRSLQTSSNLRKTWRALVSAQNENESWVYIAYVEPFNAQGVSYGASTTSGFFRAVRTWHTSLKIESKDRVGMKIVGYAGLVAALTLLTGLIRWFPSFLKNREALKNAFRPVLNRGVARAIFDLHNVGGFYAMLALLLLALSGAWKSLPWLQDSCDKLIGYEVAQNAPGAPHGGAAHGGGVPHGGHEGGRPGVGEGKDLGSGRPEGARQGRPEGGAPGKGDAVQKTPETATNYGAGIQARRAPSLNDMSPRAIMALSANVAYKSGEIQEKPASLDAIFDAQRNLAPGVGGYEIIVPDSGTDAAVTITSFGSFAGFFKPDTYYWDQYSGEFLGKTTFADLPRAEKFRTLIVPFHKGRLFSSASRYLLFLAGLIGVILPATGYILMIKRWLAKGKSRNKASEQEDDNAENASETGAARRRRVLL